MRPQVMWTILPPFPGSMWPPHLTRTAAIVDFCEMADTDCYKAREADARNGRVWPQSSGKLPPLYARTWRRWYDKGWRAVKVRVELEGEG